MVGSMMHILVTRAAGQHRTLSDRCLKLGLNVSHLPCLAIRPIAAPMLAEQIASEPDVVLFTSVNAVHNAHAHCPFPWPSLCVHAIGSATAKALQVFGQLTSLEPKPPFDSDAYLNQVKSMRAGHLLIVKGQGGRTQVRDSLVARGWNVTTVDVYKRTLPFTHPNEVSMLFQNPPDIISVTSNEVLFNLVRLTRGHHTVLFSLPLIVNSRNGAALAVELGFAREPLIASPAGDDGQIRALEHWLLGSWKG